jgi:hypothetical protein
MEDTEPKGKERDTPSRLEEIAEEVRVRNMFASKIEDLWREADEKIAPPLMALNRDNREEVALFNAQLEAHMDQMETVENLRKTQCAIVSYLETGADVGSDEYYELLLSRARLIVASGQLSLKCAFLFALTPSAADIN